jgi:SAM-dependent methyltransferase
MNPNEYAIMFEVEDAHWWYRSLRAALLQGLANLAEDAQILDIGCGTGANMASLGFHTGIDFATEAVAFCRKRGLTRTAAASATALPFANASFDAAVSCDVLCHRSITNKADLLNEVARVLTPGGLFICNLPAYQWLLSSHDHHVGTDKRFSPTEVRNLFQQTGFETVELHHWNSLLFPIAAAVRIWRKLRPPEASDLAAGSGATFNGVLENVLGVERRLANLVPMPVGLSIIAVGRRT